METEKIEVLRRINSSVDNRLYLLELYKSIVGTTTPCALPNNGHTAYCLCAIAVNVFLQSRRLLPNVSFLFKLISGRYDCNDLMYKLNFFTLTF